MNIQEFNQFRYEGRMNFSGELFQGVRFVDLDLSKVVFNECTFKDSQFVNCQLTCGSFERVLMDNVVVHQCQLYGANFYASVLREVSFTVSGLERVGLISASLRDIRITDCVVSKDLLAAEGLKNAILINNEVRNG